MPPTARKSSTAAVPGVAVICDHELCLCPRVWVSPITRISRLAPIGTMLAAAQVGRLAFDQSAKGAVRYFNERMAITAVGAANPSVKVAHPETNPAPRP